MNINVDKAREYLASRDEVMAGLIAKTEPFRWRTVNSSSSLFSDVISAIVSQQLSVKAADTIFTRLQAQVGTLTPEALLAVEDQVLREAGLSRAKVSYSKGFAQAVVNNDIDLEALISLDDEKVAEELIRHKGIGQWTADMILIFTLSRPDVFPLGDLGIRTSMSRLYRLERDDFEGMLAKAEIWRPYRSIASRYLWNSLDNIIP